jgi:hypothetical protein
LVSGLNSRAMGPWPTGMVCSTESAQIR